MKKKILFEFDFDKTLADAFEIQKEGSKAIFRPYGMQRDMTMVDYNGSTHYLITRDCLRNVVGVDPTEEEIHESKSRWVNEVKSLIPKMPIQVYDGVFDVLSGLQKQAYLGLVTGNPSDLGPVLLEGTNLSQFFPSQTQVYGDMFGEEGRIGGIKRCLAESSQHYGVDFDAVMYFGDSPKDIDAGNEAKKVIPARMYSAGISHAEGRNIDDLLAKNPDFSFRDFNNPEQVVEELLRVV